MFLERFQVLSNLSAELSNIAQRNYLDEPRFIQVEIVFL